MALQAVCPGRPRSAVARAELLEGDRSWRPGRACSRCRPAAEATAAAHPHRTTVSTMNTIALTQPSARTGRRTMPGTIRLLARWRDAPGSTCCPSALDSACARLPLRARCVRPARGESRSGALSPADGAAQARKAARTGAADRRASLRPSGEPQSLETVGRQLGLTRERVRQLQVQALKQLETELADLAPMQTAAARAAQARGAERVPA
jgi:Sigma-70, region 4